jgi:hypothetical protein
MFPGAPMTDLAGLTLTGAVALAASEPGGRLVGRVGGTRFTLTLRRDGDAVPAPRPMRRADAGGRRQCRDDLVGVLAARGRPMTRKELVAALRPTAGAAGHGAGTIAKALAELTAAGELVNTRDKRGYRLPAWAVRPPTLFAD